MQDNYQRKTNLQQSTQHYTENFKLSNKEPPKLSIVNSDACCSTVLLLLLHTHLKPNQEKKMQEEILTTTNGKYLWSFTHLIKIRTPTFSSLIICYGVGDLRKHHDGLRASDPMYKSIKMASMHSIHNTTKGPGGSMSQVIGLPNNLYKPITNTAWVRAQLCK